MKIPTPAKLNLSPDELPLVGEHIAPKPRVRLVRSLVKTITYRIISAASTMSLAWAMFGSIEAAGIFGLVDLSLNSILYFSHERLWAWIDIRPRKETK